MKQQTEELDKLHKRLIALWDDEEELEDVLRQLRNCIEELEEEFESKGGKF